MFKFFTDLFSGRLSFFNETSSSDSHIDGFDQDGNYHHINKCGGMGIDTTTGDTFIDMGGGFIQKSGSSEIYHSPFSDDSPFSSRSGSSDPFHSSNDDMFSHGTRSSSPFHSSDLGDDMLSHGMGSSNPFHSPFDDDGDMFSGRSGSSFGSLCDDDDKDPFGF